MTEVSIVSVEQFAYSEFLMSLPDPTAFYAVGVQPLEPRGAEARLALIAALVGQDVVDELGQALALLVDDPVVLGRFLLARHPAQLQRLHGQLDHRDRGLQLVRDVRDEAGLRVHEFDCRKM